MPALWTALATSAVISGLFRRFRSAVRGAVRVTTCSRWSWSANISVMTPFVALLRTVRGSPRDAVDGADGPPHRALTKGATS
jgi:hypothetical protein